METYSKMSAKDLISTNIIRFVVCLHQKSTARVELSCKDGIVFVNLFHDLGAVKEATPEPEWTKPLYNNVLKKNIKNF